MSQLSPKKTILNYDGSTDAGLIDTKPSKMIDDNYHMIKWQRFMEFFNKCQLLQASITKNYISDEDIKKIDRQLWYCNISFEIIPQLHKFNTIIDNKITISKAKNIMYDNYSDLTEDYPDGHQDGHEDHQKFVCEMGLELKKLYDDGYNKFHIFSCGHCYIDIYLIYELYIYLYDTWTGKEYLKNMKDVDLCIDQLLANSYNQCNKCKLNENPITSTFMYEGFAPFSQCQSSSYVKFKYLDVICHKLKIGDMINTNQKYRYTNIIYIYEGKGKYLRMPRKWKYYVLPFEYVKLRGCVYYLKNNLNINAILLNDNILITHANDGGWDFHNYVNNKMISNYDEYIHHDTRELEARLPSGHCMAIITESRKHYELLTLHKYENQYEIQIYSDKFDEKIHSHEIPIATVNVKYDGKYYILDELPTKSWIINALTFSKLLFKFKVTKDEILIFGNYRIKGFFDNEDNLLFNFNGYHHMMF